MLLLPVVLAIKADNQCAVLVDTFPPPLPTVCPLTTISVANGEPPPLLGMELILVCRFNGVTNTLSSVPAVVSAAVALIVDNPPYAGSAYQSLRSLRFILRFVPDSRIGNSLPIVTPDSVIVGQYTVSTTAAAPRGVTNLLSITQAVDSTVVALIVEVPPKAGQVYQSLRS